MFGVRGSFFGQSQAWAETRPGGSVPKCCVFMVSAHLGSLGLLFVLNTGAQGSRAEAQGSRLGSYWGSLHGLGEAGIGAYQVLLEEKPGACVRQECQGSVPPESPSHPE